MTLRQIYPSGILALAVAGGADVSGYVTVQNETVRTHAVGEFDGSNMGAICYTDHSRGVDP